MNRSRPFLILWTLAVFASVAAFVLHLGLRSRTFKLGYEIGRVRNEQAQLKETVHALQLEAESFRNHERVSMIAKTLLGMQPPTRINTMRAVVVPDESKTTTTVHAQR